MGTRGHGDCASRDGGVCKGARASNAARTALESYAGTRQLEHEVEE
jgi:hypothetical protein